MRIILIIGAGKISIVIDTISLSKSEKRIYIVIGDLSLPLAQKKTENHPNATAIALDIFDANQRKEAIEKADIVISMLPAHLHIEVARDCVVYKRAWSPLMLC
jgi:saccharopine dehydrogenase-like NADP-dependent oxidoreductase